MLVIPRGHKTAQVVGDMNRTLKKAREAAGAVGDAEMGHIRAKSGLSEAIEGLDAEKNKGGLSGTGVDTVLSGGVDAGGLECEFGGVCLGAFES
ncbi:hypothetical protein CU663_08645 [Pseudomonas syringae pv. actinidifoliorum]|nr:hypothetical protein [Pseudomonas syringae pv. actinidifoliorum]